MSAGKPVWLALALSLPATLGAPHAVAQQNEPSTPVQAAPNADQGTQHATPRANTDSNEDRSEVKRFVPSQPLSSDKSVSFPVDI